MTIETKFDENQRVIVFIDSRAQPAVINQIRTIHDETVGSVILYRMVAAGKRETYADEPELIRNMSWYKRFYEATNPNLAKDERHRAALWQMRQERDKLESNNITPAKGEATDNLNGGSQD